MRMCWPIRQRMSQRSRIGVPEAGDEDRDGTGGEEGDHVFAPPSFKRASSSRTTLRSSNSIARSPIC